MCTLMFGRLHLSPSAKGTIKVRNYFIFCILNNTGNVHKLNEKHRKAIEVMVSQKLLNKLTEQYNDVLYIE